MFQSVHVFSLDFDQKKSILGETQMNRIAYFEYNWNEKIYFEMLSWKSCDVLWRRKKFAFFHNSYLFFD